MNGRIDDTLQRNTLRHYFMPTRMAKFERIDNKCGQRYGATETRIQCWWECKMVQLWRTIWQFLLKLNTHVYPMTCNSSLRYLPKRIINICTKKNFTSMFVATQMFISKKMGKEPVIYSCNWITTQQYKNKLLYAKHEWLIDVVEWKRLDTREYIFPVI